MSEYRVIDLFAGLGGFSQAFEDSARWEVTTVEIDSEFDPDIVANIFNLRPSHFEPEPELVLASPPCTQFSPMAWTHEKHIELDGTPITNRARESVALVHHTLGLIQGIAPSFWFMENPRGALRWVIGSPAAVVDYCAYDHYTKKPTDLWGEHPPMTYRRCPHTTHTDAQGVTDMERGPTDPNERAKVPYGLSDAIREACERALDGDAPIQTTADEWVQA